MGGLKQPTLAFVCVSLAFEIKQTNDLFGKPIKLMFVDVFLLFFSRENVMCGFKEVVSNE